MLKKEITYEDLNGTTRTEIFYFHMSEPELFETEASYENGWEETIRKIVETTDKAGLIREFKKLILMAYGVKSDDGRQFEKSEELSKKFSQSPAYAKLFMELATDDTAAAAFIEGAFPKNLTQTLEKIEAARAPLPPPASE